MLGQVIIKHTDMKQMLIEQINAWINIGGGAFLHARELSPNEVPPPEYIRFPDRWNAGLQIKRLLKFAKEQKIPMGVYENLLKQK